MNWKLLIALIIAGGLMFVCLVCGLVGLFIAGRGGGQPELVEEVPRQQVEVVQPTKTPLATPRPIDTPRPTPTATPGPDPAVIRLAGQGFGQVGRELGFAFLVENPRPDLAIESSRYQVAAYDEAGLVVGSASGFITLLLPGQTLGIGGLIVLDEGVTAARIEAQLNEGDSVATGPLPPFTVDLPTYQPSPISPAATGIIHNPHSRDISNMYVSAVVYNEAGQIIGGGFTFLNFVLANTTTGVDVPVTSSGDVARVALYPAISGLSLLAADEPLPEGASNLVLHKYGFGQNERYAGFGVLIENPNENFSVEGTQYHLTAFAEDGRVLATEEGYVELLLPKQVLGVGDNTILDEGMTISHVDVQIKADDFISQSEALPFFRAENISYQGGDHPAVRGEIISSYSQDVTDLYVSAIAYDEAGEVVGGGFTFLDFAPANGKAAVEVPVTTLGTPTTVELYATISSLSDFE